MNTKEGFKKWMVQIVPRSYINWFGKKTDEKFEEISRSYIASFGKDVFEVDVNSIESEINEIQRNLNGRNEVKDKSFAEYDKSASNGIPKAILGRWYAKYLQGLNNNESCVSIDEASIKNNTGSERVRFEQLSVSYESDLQKSLISQSEELFPEYQIFGDNVEGIEYSINGKRIDLLLEDKKENSLS